MAYRTLCLAPPSAVKAVFQGVAGCLGTLQIGAPADVAVFDLVDGPVEFVDTRQNRRSGTKKLVPVLTCAAGGPFGRPPMPFPFTY